MKPHPQSNAELAFLADLIAGHRYAVLTLLERPTDVSSRPVHAREMDAEGSIWSMVSRRSIQHAFRQLAPLQHGGQPLLPVNLTFIVESDFIHVSVAGGAALSDDPAHIAALWAPEDRQSFPNGPTDPDLALLCVKPHRAEVWGGPHQAVVRLLTTPRSRQPASAMPPTPAVPAPATAATRPLPVCVPVARAAAAHLAAPPAAAGVPAPTARATPAGAVQPA